MRHLPHLGGPCCLGLWVGECSCIVHTVGGFRDGGQHSTARVSLFPSSSRMEGGAIVLDGSPLRYADLISPMDPRHHVRVVSAMLTVILVQAVLAKSLLQPQRSPSDPFAQQLLYKFIHSSYCLLSGG